MADVAECYADAIVNFLKDISALSLSCTFEFVSSPESVLYHHSVICGAVLNTKPSVATIVIKNKTIHRRSRVAPANFHWLLYSSCLFFTAFDSDMISRLRSTLPSQELSLSCLALVLIGGSPLWSWCSLPSEIARRYDEHLEQHWSYVGATLV